LYGLGQPIQVGVALPKILRLLLSAELNHDAVAYRTMIAVYVEQEHVPLSEEKPCMRLMIYDLHISP
jgi:hypothetical protein